MRAAVAAALAVALDHHQVNSAVRPHLAPRGRPEQHDPFWIDCCADRSDDRLQFGFVRLACRACSVHPQRWSWINRSSFVSIRAVCSLIPQPMTAPSTATAIVAIAIQWPGVKPLPRVSVIRHPKRFWRPPQGRYRRLSRIP